METDNVETADEEMKEAAETADEATATEDMDVKYGPRSGSHNL
jgi:hypothetical protein